MKFFTLALWAVFAAADLGGQTNGWQTAAGVRPGADLAQSGA